MAAALQMDKERRLELKSRIDELSTEEPERLLSLTAQRIAAPPKSLNLSHRWNVSGECPRHQ
jgi:hypothetical protein